MDDLLNQIVPIAISSAVALFAALATWAVAEVRRYVGAKIKNTEARAAMMRIADLAEITVATINQRMRDPGVSLTPEQGKQYLSAALDSIKNQLTSAMMDAAKATTGSVERYIIGQIEAAVQRQKSLISDVEPKL
jgi:hypothetical protein